MNGLPPTTKVLFTSRDILPPIEVHNFELDNLDNEKSRILFWKTLRNAGFFKGRNSVMADEVELLSQIVDTLEGYPLAIIGKY